MGRLLGLALGAALTLSCQREALEVRQDAPTLTVFAPSSLKSAFQAAEKAFEAEHPGTQVDFNFAGTQELRRQLELGARADVFASADEKHMQALVDKQLVRTPHVFAETEPVLAVFARGTPPIRDFSELPGVARLVVGSPDVPIGRYTSEILDRAEQKYGSGFRIRVESKVASRELNVRQVLAKVTLGEADAAIVYRSDVTPPRPEVRTLDIPADVNVVARYPIAVVRESSQPELARAWIDHLRTPVGRALLRDAGFRPLDGS